MKFMVTTQKHVIEEFVIEADNADEAEALAETAADMDDVPGVVRTSTAVDRETIVVLDVEECDEDEAEE